MSTLLELKNLTINFGGLMALDRVSLEVEEGKICALIGPNGAGKSTVFNVITGIYKPNSGQILYRGQDITGGEPYLITAMGIARTFQNIRLFKNLSVLDNVKIGRHCKGHAGPFGAISRLPGVKAEERDITKKAQEVLSIVGLADRQKELAKNLPYGEQRRLEIARALAAEPQLLLLDEPAAGTNPQEKLALMQMVQQIRDMGVTLMLVEHDMSFVMSLSDHVDVLNYGSKIAGGTPAAIQQNSAVVEAYLGNQVD